MDSVGCTVDKNIFIGPSISIFISEKPYLQRPLLTFKNNKFLYLYYRMLRNY
jgi:hypothetical protein